jgi:hypothetical protein
MAAITSANWASFVQIKLTDSGGTLTSMHCSAKGKNWP